MTHKLDSKGDYGLAWLAEQYVLGELDAAQFESFELLLAEDQGARDAVTSAVALLAASHAASATLEDNSLVKANSTSTWASRAAWISGVAASLALTTFLGWQFMRDKADGATALAGAWSETRESVIDDVDDELAATADVQSASHEEAEIPDWLLTAVSLKEEAIHDANRPTANPDAGEGA
jgi:hypothetical protein